MRPTTMTAIPAMKMGVLAITKAIEAMRAPTSITMTQVQAAGLLPWPSSWLWSMAPGATWRVPDLETDAGALLMENLLRVDTAYILPFFGRRPRTAGPDARAGGGGRRPYVGSSPRESRSQLSISSTGPAAAAVLAAPGASYLVRVFQ